MNRVFVSDTNIWIDLRHAGLLAEVFQLPLVLCCTDFVLEELRDFDHETLRGHGLRVEGIAGEHMAHLMALMHAHRNSSLADVSCYFLAQERGLPLLTGDGRLRRQAQRDGLEVHGVLWLMDRMVTQGVVTPPHAAEALELMLMRNARLPQEECRARLHAWRL